MIGVEGDIMCACVIRGSCGVEWVDDSGCGPSCQLYVYFVVISWIGTIVVYLLVRVILGPITL